MNPILAVVLAVAFLVGCTKKDASPEVRVPQNIETTRRGIAPPTEAQRKAMSDCITRKGQKLPERPTFTDDQRKTMVKCKTDTRTAGMAAFQACVKKAGIKLPEPPSAELRKAVMECRQEVMPMLQPPQAPR